MKRILVNLENKINKSANLLTDFSSNHQPNVKFKIRYSLLRYYLRPIYGPIKDWRINKKYKHNYYEKSLPWSWEKINYNRIAVLNLLLQKYTNPAYLEIGCASDLSFNSLPTLDKTGVDPNEGGNIRKTSDEFFANNKKLYDLIFIDGLHTYSQVRVDLKNSLSCLRLGGAIVLHDMLPRNWKESNVPRINLEASTGSVWKVAFELIKTHGIDFNIIKIDHGVGVLIKKTENVKLENYENLLLEKEFKYFYENLNLLPIIEWDEGFNWLKNK